MRGRLSGEGRSANRYLIALGSNQRHARFGSPEQVLTEAMRRLERLGEVEAVSPILRSAPVGPSRRRYANGAVVVNAALSPAQMLGALKDMEQAFGRRTGGQRWVARVLDCDIILWSGGVWHDRTLIIPHPLFRQRHFVLQPARSVAPGWRDPVTGACIRHLLARLTKAQPILR